MKVSKFLGAGAAVTLSALMLAACGSSSSSSKSTTRKTLNWTVASEIPTMDLSKATDATSFDQISNTMEGLYRLGKNSKLEKGLATSEKVSKDGLTFTLIPCASPSGATVQSYGQGLRLLLAKNG